MNLTLIAGGVATAIFLGMGAYIGALKSDVSSLEEQKISLKGRVLTLEGTITELSTAKVELDKKVQAAAQANREILARLNKKKSEIRYIKVPTQCEPALNWLTEEVAK